MRASLVLVAGAAMVALTGCGGESEAGAPAGGQTATGSAADEAYRKALGAVDEQLANYDDAVEHGRKICAELKDGKAEAKVVSDAAVRFAIDEATAKKVVDVTKASLCKG